MKPRILQLDPGAAPGDAWREPIAEAVAVLRSGGLVAFPTETVYGLGARALDAEAVRRIFAAKGRPSAHPLIVHVGGRDGADAGREARALAAEWSPRAERLARAFWPGPLTLVVPRAERVPADVAGGGDSIALRAPAHPIARALLAALGEPIAAPSANRYQTLSPTLAAHVVKSLGERVDLVLDGGPCEAGIESTVVDVRPARARILRPGALSAAALRAIEPDVDVDPLEAVSGEGAARASPGMDARHYAPRARVVLAATRDEAVREALARAGGARGKVGLILRGGGESIAQVDVRVLPDAPEAYAAGLFATLHELDDAGVEGIVIEGVPEGEAWWPVADRLRRAAS